MYSARVVARVLNGGLGICASASIILAENKEQNVPAIQKFTVTEQTTPKSSTQQFSLPPSSSLSSFSTSSPLPVSASNSNSTVLNVLACENNNQLNHNNNLAKEDYSLVVDESDGEMDGDIIPQVESASDYNCPMGFGLVPESDEENVSDFSSSQVYQTNFNLYSAPQEVLSSEQEDVITETNDSIFDISDEDNRVYLSEVVNKPPTEIPVDKARILVSRHLYETGSVGMVVCVSVNGKKIFSRGFGYADLENNLVPGIHSIMRIASISKPITICALLKLVEEGKVNLDANVKDYVPDWPEKIVDGEVVNITVRQLCSHLAGIRHYNKKGEKEEDNEFELKEYHLNKKFKQTKDALGLFKDDELFHKPGTEFLYSTHGYTLLAAVIENVTGVPFDQYMKKQFKELGLDNTFLDDHEQIIYNRSKYYVRDKYHRAKNAPMVDNSYKWAGGGFLSNVLDLDKFGNIMLYSYQKMGETYGTTSKYSNPVHNKNPRNEKSTLDNLDKEKTEEIDPNVQTKTAAANDKGTISNEQTDGVNKNEANVVTKKISHTLYTEESNHDSQNNVDNAAFETIVNDEVNIEVESMATEEVNFPQELSTPRNLKRNEDKKFLPGYLKSKTMAEMWRPAPNANVTWGGNEMGYGLGWAVRPKKKKYGYCANDIYFVAHTGGAIGASSVLLIAPKPVTQNNKNSLPRGVVVSILCNTQNVSLIKLAEELAQLFEKISLDEPAKVKKVYQC